MSDSKFVTFVLRAEGDAAPRHVTSREAANAGKRAGHVTSLAGGLLLFVGVFGVADRCAVPGVPCPSPSLNEVAAYLGLVLVILGVVILVRSGWRGSAMSWLLAATGLIPAVWFVYELARQGLCPMVSDPALARACLAAYGKMTAPVLSFGAGGLLLLTGWLRWRRIRSARDMRDAE